MYNQLTRADIEKIRAEIEHRKLVVRKEAIEAVKEARAQGDLSENFEYYAAKRDKNKNESRIRYLERIIKTATIVESDNAEDEIGLNTTVLLYFEEDDETEEITVVTTAQEDSLKGRISIESPMGKALLKHKVGDRVWIQVNKNVRYPVVVKDLRQNESVEGYKI
jgi:transcription elongation factor GreA